MRNLQKNMRRLYYAPIIGTEPILDEYGNDTLEVRTVYGSPALLGEIKPVDIAFALIADRMYKNKLKPGDLDKFTPEQIEAMKALTAKRVAEVERLYKVASDVSF